MAKRNVAFLSIFLSLGLGLGAQQKQAPTSDTFEFAVVLKAAREYCRKLEKAALDFVCLEEIKEEIDFSRDSPRDRSNEASTDLLFSFGTNFRNAPGFGKNKDVKRDNTYLFDYQFVRLGGQVKEKRVLLEKNGKKADAKHELPTPLTFHYADILLAPVQLLDDRFSEFYAYHLLGAEDLNGAEAWVLEIAPRLTLGDKYLGGKIWLKKSDASIIRIDWDPTTFGRYENILKRAEVYKAKPLVTSRTEFGFEKNGLRFPSADITEEAYVENDGKTFVRARTSISYAGYKFFTVEIETGVIK